MARVSEEYYRLRKAEIVEAAMKVCGKKTVSSITMQDIIDATGFSQGAIYRYYTNIDEILADLLSRIHTEQYGSADRVNSYIDAEMKEYDALRCHPVTVETLEERRRFIAERILRLHEIWAEELRKYLYPHKKIELEFSILADNFPERARVLFPKVVPERDINTRVFSVIFEEVKEGVLAPRIPLDEFMEYNTAVFRGILTRAIAVNSLKRNRDFDDSNGYDIVKRFETFARSSLYMLGLEEYTEKQKDELK